MEHPGNYFSLPLLSSASENGALLLLGLFGWNQDANWAFPLYYYGSDRFLSLPYAQFERGWLAGGGLAGGDCDTNWLLPLYLKYGNWFHTPILSCSLDDPQRFFSIPLLSYAGRENAVLLMGLAGWNQNCNWMAPLFYSDNDCFLSIPYTQSQRGWTAGLGLAGGIDNTNWLLPLYLKTDRWFHTPLLSWSLDETQRFFSLPLLSWSDAGDLTFLMGTAGTRKDSSWILPLYYWDDDSFFSLPYAQSPHGWFAGLGLAGSVDNSSWLLPLYIKNRNWYHSLVFSWSTDESPKFFSLPLLSWASHDRATFLLGLAGARSDRNWMLPLYYWDQDGLLTMPFSYWNTGWALGCGLIGASSNSSWALPLYIKDGQNFSSLLYCQRKNPESTSALIPWLLSSIDWNNQDEISSWQALLILAGMKSDHNNDRHWVAPFYYSKSNVDFDSLSQQATATQLPEGLKFKNYNVPNEKGVQTTMSRPVTGDDASHSVITPIVQYHEKISTAYSGKQRQWYHVKDATSWSVFRLLWHDYHLHERIFHVDNKKLVGERNSSNTRLLTFLYAADSKSDSTKHASESSSSILWRLWRRTEKNGNVSTDIFPGISHDTRTDGYRKTSFLWKLFCYEEDPKTGSHLDLFFIPFK